jgi:hypothetical protein
MQAARGVAFAQGTPAMEPPSHGTIAAYAAPLAAATFVIRIWYPQDRWIGFLGYIQMEPAHLPQYASLFVIGVLAWPRRWIGSKPCRRGADWLGSQSASGSRSPPISWWAQASFRASIRGIGGYALGRPFFVSGYPFGLPVLFRELGLGKGRTWRALAENAYAVYLFHYPIVLFLLWALMDAPAPKWARLLITVVGAIFASFAFTNWVILRLPFARARRDPKLAVGHIQARLVKASKPNSPRSPSPRTRSGRN